MTWLRPSSSLRLVPFALALVACNTGPTAGSLSLSYKLGPFGGTCDQFEVATVKVDLEGSNYHEEEACDPSEPITIDGIEAGSYDLLVQGILADGNTVEMDNVGGNADDDSVEIVGRHAVTVHRLVAHRNPGQPELAVHA